MVLFGFVISCKKDDDNNVEQLRDRNQQFITDSIAIYDFLNSHSIAVDENFNTSFDVLTEGSNQQSIYKQKVYPLQHKKVKVDGVEYKIYYLKLREGLAKNTSAFDSILVSYKGNLLNRNTFDWKPNAFWAAPGNNIASQNIFSTKGSVYIIPEFKSGSFDENPDGTMNFYQYGAGVMFVPSGLGFFNYSQIGVPSYSSFIVSFKLYDVKYRDHDFDGVLSMYEDLNENGDFYDDDTDGDGISNFLDPDDDGDGIPTKYEDLNKNGNYFDDDANDNGIPSFLDKEEKLSNQSN